MFTHGVQESLTTLAQEEVICMLGEESWRKVILVDFFFERYWRVCVASALGTVEVRSSDEGGIRVGPGQSGRSDIIFSGGGGLNFRFWTRLRFVWFSVIYPYKYLFHPLFSKISDAEVHSRCVSRFLLACWDYTLLSNLQIPPVDNYGACQSCQTTHRRWGRTPAPSVARVRHRGSRWKH